MIRRSDSHGRILMPMARHQARAAVCVLTIERQPSGIVITMRVNPDVAESQATKTLYTNTRTAVAAVAKFLETFAERSSA